LSDFDFDFDLAAKFASEDARIQELNCRILDHYDHLAEDEIQCLEFDCDASFTEMIWVVEVNKADVLVWDYIHDVDHSKVVFPSDLHELLRPRDVFLATLGMRSGKWHVLYLSPRYESSFEETPEPDCEICEAGGVFTH
jgi:hypothetical protein